VRGRFPRFAIGVAASAALSLGFASASSAALTTALIDDELRISSDAPNEVNHAIMEVGNDQLEFVDQEAGVSAGACPVNGSAIVCGNVLNGVERFRFDLRGGNDRLLIFDPRFIAFPTIKVFLGDGNDQITSLFAPVAASLGPGDDVAQTSFLADKIRGNGGDDELLPGPGDDLVRGGSGDDLVRGGWDEDFGLPIGRSDGRDKLLAGNGKDKVLAKDFTKDRRIDCGGGRDTVRRDRFDPAGRHCE
jgi:RTX calcium-binding nonapeptide repeat (4 copies)